MPALSNPVNDLIEDSSGGSLVGYHKSTDPVEFPSKFVFLAYTKASKAKGSWAPAATLLGEPRPAGEEASLYCRQGNGLGVDL